VNARDLDHAGAQLRRRRSHAAEACGLAAVTGLAAVLASVLAPALVLPLAAGAALEAALAAAALYSYRERVARLALEPSAYVLPEVARYGRPLAEPSQRARLSAWISEILADAHAPGNLYLADRVIRFAHELEALARDLIQPGTRIQPASAVACRRLLTHAVESPLYNPRVPADELSLTLRRIRAGISAV
jgi:hypothetical protein